MDFSDLIKKHKKKSIIDFDSPSLVKTDYDKEKIYKIIPNREPFIFLDRITGVDLKNQCITGTRKILKDDPVFEGHSPGMHVYPGVLQLEMISELFCCLYYFVSNNTVDDLNKPHVNLRATRMHDALLQYGLFPEDEVTIATKVLENNGLTFTGIGQIIKNGQIPLLVISEFLPKVNFKQRIWPEPV